MARIEQIDKSHKGKTIYLHGTGNARNRAGKTPLLEALVVKVNPKSVVLMTGEREIKVNRQGHSQYNFGYHMYESIDDFKAEQLKQTIHTKFDHYCRHEVDTETTLKIAEILGVDLNIENYLKEQ